VFEGDESGSGLARVLLTCAAGDLAVDLGLVAVRALLGSSEGRFCPFESCQRSVQGFAGAVYGVEAALDAIVGSDLELLRQLGQQLLTLVELSFAFISARFTLVGDAVALVRGALALVRSALALVRGALALVRGALALVRGALALVGGAVALVGCPVTLVGDLVESRPRRRPRRRCLLVVEVVGLR
jgi:hypothetical protein